MRMHIKSSFFFHLIQYNSLNIVLTCLLDGRCSGELLKSLRGHKNTIASLAAVDVSNIRGGAILISCSRKGNSTRVWKYSTGECLRCFKGHVMDVNDVELFSSPDTSSEDLIVVSASRDTTVRLYMHSCLQFLQSAGFDL